MEGVAVLRQLSPPCPCLSLHLDCVSAPRSRNRACGFPAFGSRSRSCFRSREATLPDTQVCEAVVHPQPLLSESARASRTAPSASDFPQQRSPPTKGSTAMEGSTPQATIPPGVSALLHQPTPCRREERFRSAVLGDSNHRRTTPDRARRTTPSPGVRLAARLGRFRSSLRWPMHALLARRASEGERVMVPSVTLA